MAQLNLKKFIDEHYRGGITARDVIREGITNSIHAGATTVHVDLRFGQCPTLFGDDTRDVLDQISITDDGEGFTAENLEYFNEVCTNHKDDIGGKGVGRLAFLKYAKHIVIESQLDNEFIRFKYTPSFKLTDVERFSSSGERRTVVQISQPKDNINTQVAKLVNSTCDDFRLLFFLKGRLELQSD